MSTAQAISAIPAATETRSSVSEAQQVERWLSRFARFLTGEEQGKSLFLDDSHWKDALAFTWDIRTFKGRQGITDRLAAARSDIAACDFVVAQNPPPQIKVRAGIQVLEAFFNFRTKHGRGRGIVRLAAREDGSNTSERPLSHYDTAWTLLTTLQELTGLEEKTGARRPRGGTYAQSFGDENWHDRRRAAQEYRDREPDVLIVGGGHAGMTLAARLGQIGVDALIIDKHERVGDNWRKRYDALTLHNESWVCELPYIPYPPTWPVYLPKDMVAGWFENYAWAMELNYWTGTELLTAAFDATAKRWTVRLRNRAGVEKKLSPKHLVIATGMSGAPKIPKLAGIEDFKGQVLHTHSYADGTKWKGKDAIVVGTGNSAHDVAHDLHASGANVTMIQRSPTTIVSVEPAAQLVFKLYSEGPSTEDCDLLSVSMTYDVMMKSHRALTKQMLELDKELIAGLEAVGFRTDSGPDETGYYLKYLRHGGGYYLNVGCSELIAAGKIKIVQNDTIDRYVDKGVKLRDGTMIPADLIVLATGYENMQDGAGRLVGKDIADKVGPVWGFDERGDARNVWKQTAQENLWFMAGSFAQCRTYSRYVAIQIKAIEDGLIAHTAAGTS